jgi:hypothetical protein
MPSLDPSEAGDKAASPAPLTRLPFPSVTKSHILHCSYHHWHPLYVTYLKLPYFSADTSPSYKSISPKARLIPLTDPFLAYLRADGIVLPPDSNEKDAEDDFSDDPTSDDEEADPSAEWQEIHSQIRATIAELGGNVTPKLNWSAPKDATWIAATNSMECRSPNDIYLLLKSSDFITHDLEHAFDDTHSNGFEEASIPGANTTGSADQPQNSIPYHLVLRKYFQVNPSLEFRCFVRKRKLLCISQRDLNHYDFLASLRDEFSIKIQEFFDKNLKNSFPDPNFTFDVYLPNPAHRVWLLDINPWAQRTDPLLFSWLEILQMEDEPEFDTSSLRLPLVQGENPVAGEISDTTSDSDDEVQEVFEPEFRLVGKDDPEAYSFSTPQYSAHKLPREVVDASKSEGGLREFMGQWQDVLARRVQEDLDADSD